MCGIIGILGNEAAAPRVIESLRRLEYRGYDSAGIASLEDGVLQRRRAPGKLKALETVLDGSPLQGKTAIGHTRWATHGAPTETNAHPHVSGRVAVVHNGIIENFKELREKLSGNGRSFMTETDSETIAHLIDDNLSAGMSPSEAVHAALKELRGAFGIAVMFEGEDDLMIGARKGSPLVIGVGDGEMYLGSDAFAVGPFTNKVVYLNEDEWCVITRDSWDVFDVNGDAVQHNVQIVEGAGALVDKGNHRHFMLKEIYEQPESTSRTVSAYIDTKTLTVKLPESDKGAGPIDFAKFDSAYIVACGTAYYAGAVAEYWFEQIARMPVEIDIASEFRYRQPALNPNSLAIFVSQSGETADTLAAMRYCKEQGLTTAAILNVPTSSIGREADYVFPTLAGAEIGVASTKAFTAQLCALAAVAVSAGVQRGHLSDEAASDYAKKLMEIPRMITDMLKVEQEIEGIAIDLSKSRDVLYLGRGPLYPIALEGALKLKEISYIHAEGYAAGELKHGPIALIDENTPTVISAPMDPLFEKTLSNLQEVAARRGPVLLITDEEGAKLAGDTPWRTIVTPGSDPFIAPILQSVPIQLLAYHVAVEKGTDVDQPRNLAKSVTVE